jgi:Protein of unknown function (DUF3307)
MNEITPIQIALTVLYALNVKHFIADYSLRNAFINRKSNERGWLLPMTAHAGIHGLLTFVIVAFVSNTQTALIAFLFDAVSHFIIDRLKVSANLNLSNTAIQIGDQTAHEINYILIAVFVVVG